MMLKTSSRKLNPFWNMIGFTLRKNIGIIVILCIAALLYCPGSFIINEDYIISAENSYRDYITENFAYNVTVISAIAAVFFNVINFSFLYKKNSSDVFHAFPLTRTELLLSRFVSGLISTFIPTLVCYVSFGVITAIFPWIGSFTQLAYYLLHTIIVILVCSTFSLIFIISAGSTFDLGVSLVGANLALLAVGWIFDSILTETLLGYNGYATSDIMYNLSPPYFCAVGISSANDVIKYGISRQSIDFLVRSVIYIAVFAIASILLYNRRKAEKGGTAYAYKFMYLGCSLLAGICGGFLIGMIFNGTVTSFGFWFFAIVGCVLTAGVYGTVTNRGFKGVWRSIIMGAFSAVTLIAVAVSGITGGFGYSNRMPDKNKIKSASISVFNENIPFEETQKILDLHKAILDTNATDYDFDYVTYGDADYAYDAPYRYSQNVKFYYELENGKSMSRDFTVYSQKVADKLLAIYKSEERLKMINEHIDIVNAEQFNLYFFYNNDYYSVNISKSEADEFIDLYWQDVQNSDASVFSQEGYEFIELSGYRVIDNNRDHYFSFQFEFHKSFENTTQFIQKYNLIERSKEQNELNEKF